MVTIYHQLFQTAFSVSHNLTIMKLRERLDSKSMRCICDLPIKKYIFVGV